jgi:hypothetical protein
METVPRQERWEANGRAAATPLLAEAVCSKPNILHFSLRFLLHGTPKLVCYGGPVAAVGAALGERGPFILHAVGNATSFPFGKNVSPFAVQGIGKTHETRSYH